MYGLYTHENVDIYGRPLNVMIRESMFIICQFQIQLYSTSLETG